MHSGQMDTHAVLAAELFPAVLARVHERVGEMDALDVLHDVVLVGAGLLADGALVQLGLGVEHRVLLECTVEATCK